MVENGTVALSSTSGATFTSENVISYLNDRRIRCQSEEEQRRAFQLSREQRAAEREELQFQEPTGREERDRVASQRAAARFEEHKEIA